jgi:tRNA-splicing ligase RtcB
VPNSQVCTLMWADEAAIEEEARAQLRNVAGLPWTHGVRVMPDDLGRLRSGIERGVPVGFSSHADEPRTVRQHAELGARYRAVMDGFDDLFARHR